MTPGWIKLHRRMLNWEWWDDLPTFRLFVYLLLAANFHPSKYRGSDVPAGSVLTGRKKLSEKTGLSEQQVRTALNKLKSTGEITITSKAKFSIISIAKWDEYQDINQHSNQLSTSNQPHPNKVRRKEGVLPDTESDLFGNQNETHSQNAYPDAQETFDLFWKHYPRKIAKGQARKAFATACKRVNPAIIVSAARGYDEQCRNEGTDLRFIKHATTWLNNQCWEDFTPQSDDPAMAAYGKAISEWQQGGKSGPMPRLADFQ